LTFNFDDFAGNFRADLDLEHRLDLAVGDHQFGDVAAGDLFRGNGIGGVLLMNLLATAPATTSRPRIEKRIIFRSLLLLLFAMFLKIIRQLSAPNVSDEILPWWKRQIREQGDLPFVSGFALCHVSRREYTLRGRKVTINFEARRICQIVVGQPAATRAL
jgi:hypothetical protein